VFISLLIDNSLSTKSGCCRQLLILATFNGIRPIAGVDLNSQPAKPACKQLIFDDYQHSVYILIKPDNCRA
jgi:hypothetical protein